MKTHGSPPLCRVRVQEGQDPEAGTDGQVGACRPPLANKCFLAQSVVVGVSETWTRFWFAKKGPLLRGYKQQDVRGKQFQWNIPALSEQPGPGRGSGSAVPGVCVAENMLGLAHV